MVYFAIDIIRLPEAVKKYNKRKKDKILQWMMFLCNTESMKMCEIMKENKDIKEVNKKMKRIIHYMKNTKSWQTKAKSYFW